MAVQKTLFKKYLGISMTILLGSFLVLGTILLIFISKYWEDEKHDLLEGNAKGISALVARNSTAVGSGFYLVDSKMMQGFLSTFSSNINADIFITNQEGEILLCSNSKAGSHQGAIIPVDIMNAALNGGYDGTSDLGGLYGHMSYVVSVPIVIDTTNEQLTVGAVFTATDARAINAFQFDVLKILLLASVAAFFISFCLIWMLSYNMVKPLRQMAVAAYYFGNGDFTQRVPAASQDEIGQLAIAFNQMADSLAASENTRRSFIANVSHELKTPMTTISGFIDGILDGTIPKEKQEYYLKIVSKETKRLSRLVKTMLDLSRIDNGELKVRKQRFDIMSIVLSVLLSFEQKIEEKGLAIKGLEQIQSIYIDGDPDMIHQVAYNLVENAVKFVEDEGYISVAIEEEYDRVVVSIENSGQGIPSDEIDYIFDKFYKTDKSRSQDKNGMGLGLYIVKMILKLHGGDIKAESEEGKFCRFTFWLPKTNTAKKDEIFQ